MFNSPVVMGGQQNSSQVRFQAHYQQQQQPAYQLPSGAPHPVSEHQPTQVIYASATGKKTIVFPVGPLSLSQCVRPFVGREKTVIARCLRTIVVDGILTHFSLSL